MTKVKRKAGDVRAPADADEASRFLARIGEIDRHVAAIQILLDTEVAQAKTKAEAQVKPLSEECDRLTRGLQLWAEANREALTNGGRTKTVALPAGEISWRQRPPSVRLRDVAAVLADLGRLGLTRFIRRKEEVDKEALLREPSVAATVPGVAIASGGEDFVVAPIELPLGGNGAPALSAPVPAGRAG